jgi:hypothetical protein
MLRHRDVGGRLRRTAVSHPNERTNVEHQIEITSAKRLNGNCGIIGIGRYFASHKGEVIGEWRVPECDAARWLLEHGHANEGGTLVTTRNGRAAMSGNAGWLADRTVEENDRTSPRWIKFRAFDLKPASEDLADAA